jgi:hypothetical protein
MEKHEKERKSNGEELKNTKIKNMSRATRVSRLVRDLSNSDDVIEGNPHATRVLKKLVRFAEEKRATHIASENHFATLNAVFFWPSIILTTVTSGASFLATQFPLHAQSFNIAIGIMACLSTLIVALSETYRYGSKAEQHGLAAESYENLRTKLFFKAIELQMNETRCLDEDNNNSTVNSLKTFFCSVEDQIIEIARQCKDLVPHKIVSEYKNNRHTALVESLKRNIDTVIVQDSFSKVINKLARGQNLTTADIKLMEIGTIYRKNQTKI